MKLSAGRSTNPGLKPLTRLETHDVTPLAGTSMHMRRAAILFDRDHTRLGTWTTHTTARTCC